MVEMAWPESGGAEAASAEVGTVTDGSSPARRNRGAKLRGLRQGVFSPERGAAAGRGGGGGAVPEVAARAAVARAAARAAEPAS